MFASSPYAQLMDNLSVEVITESTLIRENVSEEVWYN